MSIRIIIIVNIDMSISYKNDVIAKTINHWISANLC